MAPEALGACAPLNQGRWVYEGEEKKFGTQPKECASDPPSGGHRGLQGISALYQPAVPTAKALFSALW